MHSIRAHARRGALIAALVLSAGVSARADTLILADGRRLEGEVTEDGDTYVLRSPGGIVSRFPKRDVVSVKKAPTAFQLFDEKKRKLQASEDRESADAWFELGRYADENRLTEEAAAAHQRAVLLNPDHEGARHALGFIRHGGKWVEEDEVMRARGMVKVNGEWVSRDQVREPERLPLRDAAPVGGSVLSGGPEWVPCPRCNGTRWEIWLTCKSCLNSGRPGFTNHGNYMLKCARCNGTAKVPGLSCRWCGGRGKIDANNPPREKTRKIPTGYHACPGCGGTGVEHWLPCIQCKNGPATGVIDMGDYCLVCNRCMGRGRIPGTVCPQCKGMGKLRDDE